jgi:hypothetical protein
MEAASQLPAGGDHAGRIRPWVDAQETVDVSARAVREESLVHGSLRGMVAASHGSPPPNSASTISHVHIHFIDIVVDIVNSVCHYAAVSRHDDEMEANSERSWQQWIPSL